ncbi:UDP-2,4-diacetamido-2,4,6-trideoxy-beta-L-altropyranose hydrolase [Paenibacillus sp. FSL H8-0034]|uniref:UDP-2,4-diacetamido-2,4, 6-trideoxy-beta-L-altropyranose hydrolase n=1 Tax=Paenibacillus sp. FSL H8-0034 TaxID=2954671 RepID=UPI0030F95565
MEQRAQVLKGKMIWFRADASIQTGSGHVMRCLTLAKQCRAHGADVHFFCRQTVGNLFSFIVKEGFQLHSLPPLADNRIETPHEMLEYLANHTSPDWLIVDHYGIDYTWEAPIRKQIGNLFIIDDLANRKHDCTGLLDQNLQPNMESRYIDLIPNGSKLFLGPSYALLREEFYKERVQLRNRTGPIRRILISFGGSDPTGESRKALCALREWSNPDFQVDLIAGALNPDTEWLISQAQATAHIKVHRFTDRMSSFMAQSDLAIGAGGSSTWERLYLGLPCAVIVVADNQLTMTEEAAKHQLCWSLGNSVNVTADGIRSWVKTQLDDPRESLVMSRSALVHMPLVKESDVSPIIEFLKGGKIP